MTDPRTDPRLKYDGRFHCRNHRDTALASIDGSPLFCPLCSPQPPAVPPALPTPTASLAPDPHPLNPSCDCADQAPTFPVFRERRHLAYCVWDHVERLYEFAARQQQDEEAVAQRMVEGIRAVAGDEEADRTLALLRRAARERSVGGQQVY